MNYIIIGICTFNRKSCLKTLLLSIAELSVPENIVISILIVNNHISDAEKLSNLIDSLSIPFSLKLVHESIIGLASARNRVLREAFMLGAHALVFTDDDCIVPRHWFITLYQAYIQYGCHMVTGPRYYVLPSHSHRLSTLLIKESQMLAANDKQTGSPVTIAATNNVLFNLSPIQQHNLWFDIDFNLSGGEDTMFFISLYEKTKKPGIYVKDAYVYETLHENRISMSWVFTHYLSQGFLLAQISRKAPQAVHLQSLASTLKKAPLKISVRILKWWLRAITALGGLSIDIVGFILMYGAFFWARLLNRKYNIYPKISEVRRDQ